MQADMQADRQTGQTEMRYRGDTERYRGDIVIQMVSE